jgi:hypothetical protein
MVTILVVPMSLLLMVLPVVVLILYVLYLSEHYAITHCGHYIREYIEPVVGKPNSWEHWEPWKGWEQWLGSTWLEYRAASKVGYGTQQVERRRVHEDLQMVAFRVLYLSLFFVAAVSAGFVCFRATEQLTESVGYAVEAVVVLISLYIIAGGYVWWKVQKAATQVGHKIENEEADLAVTSSVTLLVGFPVPPGAGSRSGGRPRQNQRSTLSPAGQQAP